MSDSRGKRAKKNACEAPAECDGAPEQKRKTSAALAKIDKARKKALKEVAASQQVVSDTKLLIARLSSDIGITMTPKKTVETVKTKIENRINACSLMFASLESCTGDEETDDAAMQVLKQLEQCNRALGNVPILVEAMEGKQGKDTASALLAALNGLSVSVPTVSSPPQLAASKRLMDDDDETVRFVVPQQCYKTLVERYVIEELEAGRYDEVIKAMSPSVGNLSTGDIGMGLVDISHRCNFRSNLLLKAITWCVDVKTVYQTIDAAISSLTKLRCRFC